MVKHECLLIFFPIFRPIIRFSERDSEHVSGTSQGSENWFWPISAARRPFEPLVSGFGCLWAGDVVKMNFFLDFCDFWGDFCYFWGYF